MGLVASPWEEGSEEKSQETRGPPALPLGPVPRLLQFNTAAARAFRYFFCFWLPNRNPYDNKPNGMFRPRGETSSLHLLGLLPQHLHLHLLLQGTRPTSIEGQPPRPSPELGIVAGTWAKHPLAERGSYADTTGGGAAVIIVGKARTPWEL